MQCFWIFGPYTTSRTCGNCLGIYGAIYIGVASQSSNGMNIPFTEKGIYGMKNVAWRGWIKGRILERFLENQGPLEQGKKICSSSKSKELLQIKPTGKSRNKPEKQKSQNPGCHKPTPLRKISSSRFGCSGNHWKHTVLRNPVVSRVSSFLHSVPSVVSKIF